MTPALILHGGAGLRGPNPLRLRRVRDKLRHITAAAYQRLLKSGALEAVTDAVRLMEDDPAFNAGTGSVLQADGAARLTASVMESEAMRFAAVINLQRIKNPVIIAKCLLEEQTPVLDGQGAYRFARKLGLPRFETRTSRALSRWRKKIIESASDTVGACALDAQGRLAAATSTGGRGMEFPGRVSDSGMPVSNFVNACCAVAATGHGEDIMDEGLAIRIAQRVQDGSTLRGAFQKTFREIRSAGRSAGAIGLDRRGHIAWATTTEILLFAWRKGHLGGTF